MTRSNRARLAVGLLCAMILLPAAASAQDAPICEAPQVLIVLDKSSSMTTEMPSGMTRWQAARAAIRELTTTFAENIDFGLAIYPAVNGANTCDPGRVTVDVGRNTSAEIMAGLGDAPPAAGNWTATAQTLNRVSRYAPILDHARANHVILITDGEQWCYPYDSSQRFLPVEAVMGLRDAGVTVHIVGFSDSVDALALNRCAVAAGTALPGCDPTLRDTTAENQCYTRADDVDDLRAALADIARSITDETCDGFDNDCDGDVDDGFDVDTDRFTTCGTDFTRPGTTTPDLVDCNDADGSAYPGAAEVCDGVDNDCDGSVDEGCECLVGETQSCGSDVGECAAGTQTCASGAWGECEGATDESSEICDGRDQDCDSSVDEGATCDPGQGCIDGACVDLTAPPEEGGCGCVAAGVPVEKGAAAALLALGLLGLVVVRSRRRRGRS